MRPEADLTPLVQHQNAVGIHDGGNPLGDDDGCRVFVAAGQRFAQRRVGAVVKGGGAVIQYQQLRLTGQRPRDQQPLPLAAGEVIALLSNPVIKPAFEGTDKTGGLRVLRRLPQALIRDVAVLADVFAQCIGNHKIILKNDSCALPKLPGGDGFDIPSLDADAA